MPGSWTPLALIVGLFALKYLVGILVAMHMPVVHAALLDRRSVCSTAHSAALSWAGPDS